MTLFEKQGNDLRNEAKKTCIGIYEFFPRVFSWGPRDENKLKYSVHCGFDWGGNYENATSSNQQYWVVALLRELEKEGKIKPLTPSKLWKLI